MKITIEEVNNGFTVEVSTPLIFRFEKLCGKGGHSTSVHETKESMQKRVTAILDML